VYTVTSLISLIFPSNSICFLSLCCWSVNFPLRDPTVPSRVFLICSVLSSRGHRTPLSSVYGLLWRTEQPRRSWNMSCIPWTWGVTLNERQSGGRSALMKVKTICNQKPHPWSCTPHAVHTSASSWRREAGLQWSDSSNGHHGIQQTHKLLSFITALVTGHSLSRLTPSLWSDG